MGIGGVLCVQVEYRYRVKKGAVAGDRRSHICFSGVFNSKKKTVGTFVAVTGTTRRSSCLAVKCIKVMSRGPVPSSALQGNTKVLDTVYKCSYRFFCS